MCFSVSKDTLGHKQALSSIALVFMIAVVVIAGASIYLLSSSSSQRESLASMQTSAQTVNSTLGLELSLSINSTSLVYGGGINITVKLQNVLNKVITLYYPSSDWARPFLPGNICFEIYDFQVYSGYYAANNISSAKGDQALPVFGPLFGCHPESGDLVIQPLSDKATGSAYDAPLAFSYPVNEYYTNPGPSPPLTPFPVGICTIVAADAWGQIVLLHFTVVPS